MHKQIWVFLEAHVRRYVYPHCRWIVFSSNTVEKKKKKKKFVSNFSDLQWLWILQTFNTNIWTDTVFICFVSLIFGKSKLDDEA